MKKRKLSTALTLGLVVFFGVSLVGLAEAKTVIRAASPFKTGHILVEAVEKFKDLVETESKGNIEVQLNIGKESEESVGVMCSEGKVEVQATGGEPLEVYAPQYFFFNTPYVMKNFDHLMRVWGGRLGDEARALVEKKGNMKYLGIVYRGLRQMTSNKPIYTPEDVSMMKLRLPGVPNWIAVWKEIGATPVPVPLTGLYDSLKTGKAEASEGDLPQIASFKLNEVQSHLTITNHMVQAGQVLINKGFFDGLSKGDQDLIVKAAKEAVDWANEKISKGETKILIDLQKKGMQVVIPDADLFREKGKPAVEELFRTEWPVTTWKEVLAQ